MSQLIYMDTFEVGFEIEKNLSPQLLQLALTVAIFIRAKLKWLVIVK